MAHASLSASMLGTLRARRGHCETVLGSLSEEKHKMTCSNMLETGREECASKEMFPRLEISVVLLWCLFGCYKVIKSPCLVEKKDFGLLFLGK